MSTRAATRRPVPDAAVEPRRILHPGPSADLRCARCGYGIVVGGPPPECPMCHGSAWEHVAWRPFSGRRVDDR